MICTSKNTAMRASGMRQTLRTAQPPQRAGAGWAGERRKETGGRQKLKGQPEKGTPYSARNATGNGYSRLSISGKPKRKRAKSREATRGKPERELPQRLPSDARGPRARCSAKSTFAEATKRTLPTPPNLTKLVLG